MYTRYLFIAAIIVIVLLVVWMFVGNRSGMRTGGVGNGWWCSDFMPIPKETVVKDCNMSKKQRCEIVCRSITGMSYPNCMYNCTSGKPYSCADGQTTE
jgi:hypothetical protein